MLFLFHYYIAFSGAKHGSQQDTEVVPESTSKIGVKRKKDGAGGQKSKVVKTDGDVSASKAIASENAENSAHEKSEFTELESKMEAQSKDIWTLKDDLKKYVTTAELRQMLDANDQDSTGSELDLRDRWYASFSSFFFYCTYLKKLKTC